MKEVLGMLKQRRRQRWQIMRLVEEWNSSPSLLALRRLGAATKISAETFHHLPPTQVERMLLFEVVYKGREYGFTVHELRNQKSRTRRFWVDVGATIGLSRKFDNKVVEAFRYACKCLLIRIMWDIIQEYDYQLSRSIIFRIDFDEKQQQLIIEFTQPFRQKFGQSCLIIPIEQLSEQALLSALAQVVGA
jgi:hypothetical protein